MTLSSRWAAAGCLFVLLLGVAGSRAAKPPADTAIPYSKIAPLMKAQCESCHNPARHPEKVDLSSYQALMKSGEHGPIVIPGHPEQSKLIKYIDGEKQPRMPMGKPAMSEKDVTLIKKWIAAGAKG